MERTTALGIITVTSVSLYVNTVTKYSQERDGCHHLSILGIKCGPRFVCGQGLENQQQVFYFQKHSFCWILFSIRWHQDANLSPPGAGQAGGWARWEGQVERGRTSSWDHRCWWAKISNNNACRRHLENNVLDEWVCSVGSSDEPVHYRLLSRSPSYHPVERNANQRRTRKAVDVELGAAGEPASQPSPASGGDAKASRDVGKLHNGKRVGLTCALTWGCRCGERQTGHLKWEEANVMGQGCIFGFSWLVLSWKRRQKFTMMSATHQVLPFGTYCHKAVFYFLDCYYRQ